MNRNRVSDGRPTQRASSRSPQGPAGAEVIYVGRASFWTEHDGQRFQEMPESPPPQGARAAESARDASARAGVPAPIAPVSSGATVILGINLSGPIVFQPDAEEEPELRDDSNGTTLPAGEMSLPRATRNPRTVLPPSFTSLMTVSIVAFSMGVIVSPLGEAPASHGGATVSPAPVRAAIVQPRPAPAPSAPLIVPTTRPLIVPSAAPSVSHAKASPFRTLRVGETRERTQTAWAPKKHDAARRLFAAASVRASASSARAAADLDSDAVADDSERPSRKSVEKESVDLTKQGAAAIRGDRKRAAKPWVDPWAD